MRSSLLFLLPILLFAGEIEDEILAYKSRLETEVEKERIWDCQWNLGNKYEELDQWHEALYWYLEAYQTNSVCLDPLLKIATYYRAHDENDLAYIFAKHGARYHNDYHFEEELSIVSFYTRFKEDGYKAASDLLMRKNVPWHIKYQTYRNLLFYIPNLKNTRYQPIEIELPFVAVGSDERYSPMNPSIQKTEQGYKVICRSVNYTQKGARDFFTNDPEGFFTTRNFLLHYDRKFQLLSQEEITEDLPRELFPSCIVKGLEDCRIFDFNGESWFTCTTRDTNPDGTPQISLCKLAENGGAVEKLIPLEGPDPTRCEKNWLPFIRDNELHFLYWYDPFTIYKPNLHTGQCETVVHYEPTADFSLFRGSAGPIPFDDGYLVLVHEIIQNPDLTRYYLHRFFYMDKYFMVKQISKPFTFLHHGVEFCGSMTIDHSGKNLIMALGIEDSKAYLTFTDLNLIRSLLQPLHP